MYRIIIDNLRLKCIIGVKPEERLNPQEIILSASLSLDLSTASASDNLADTVDYESLSDGITLLVEKSDFKLLEKLASEVAKFIKQETKAEVVSVTVKKPSAINNADYAAVEFTL